MLTPQEFAFVSALHEVVGVVCRNDFNKPVGRMWLFGIVTFLEMELTRLVREHFPGERWVEGLPPGRAAKARDLQAERRRRGRHSDLLSCTQRSDKARVLIEDPRTRPLPDLGSKKRAHRLVRELEPLRNHLAHAQDVVIHDWAMIARMSYWLTEGTEEPGAMR